MFLFYSKTWEARVEVTGGAAVLLEAQDPGQVEEVAGILDRAEAGGGDLGAEETPIPTR